MTVQELTEALKLALPDMDHVVVLPSRFRGPRHIEVHSAYSAETESGYDYIAVAIDSLPDDAAAVIEAIRAKRGL